MHSKHHILIFPSAIAAIESTNLTAAAKTNEKLWGVNVMTPEQAKEHLARNAWLLDPARLLPLFKLNGKK